MMTSAIQAALLLGVAVFAATLAVYFMMQAAQAREQLITHTEDLAADPAVLSDPMRRRSFLVRWADRYDRSPRVATMRARLRRAALSWKPSDFTIYRRAATAGIA
ncbi:MAG: hypothetical protein H7Z42_04235 [Roseiflexaceae bacterium]|nr:hypothetical protein [Roseiflexaceae bacterium]